jgi:hypothetical protein
LITKWGSEGTENGKFYYLDHIVVEYPLRIFRESKNQDNKETNHENEESIFFDS